MTWRKMALMFLKLQLINWKKDHIIAFLVLSNKQTKTRSIYSDIQYLQWDWNQRNILLNKWLKASSDETINRLFSILDAFQFLHENVKPVYDAPLMMYAHK